MEQIAAVTLTVPIEAAKTPEDAVRQAIEWIKRNAEGASYLVHSVDGTTRTQVSAMSALAREDEMDD